VTNLVLFDLCHEFDFSLLLAFFCTWLWNGTASVLIYLLLHAGFTPAQNLFTLDAGPAPSGGAGLADSVDLVILGVYITAALCLTLATRDHLGFTADQTNAAMLGSQWAGGPRW
jgi:uncharacterized protein